MQRDANHLYLLSSLCLMLPSIPLSLILGSCMFLLVGKYILFSFWCWKWSGNRKQISFVLFFFFSSKSIFRLVWTSVHSFWSAFTVDLVSDVWDAKIPVMVPLFGFIVGDLNYVLQCVFFKADPRWLLLSDLASGFTGGYSALFG